MRLLVTRRLPSMPHQPLQRWALQPCQKKCQHLFPPLHLPLLHRRRRRRAQAWARVLAYPSSQPLYQASACSLPSLNFLSFAYRFVTLPISLTSRILQAALLQFQPKSRGRSDGNADGGAKSTPLTSVSIQTGTAESIQMDTLQVRQ